MLDRSLFKFVILFSFLISGCTHALHQYHAGEQKPFHNKSDYQRVSAKSEQFVIMGFVTQTDYVNEAYLKLQQECPSGEITGIHTRYSTDHGFFSWTNTVKMTGTCIN